MRALPIIVAIVLAVFSLVDLVMSPPTRVRALPRWAWVLVILLPVAGPIAWLTMGRPSGEPGGKPDVIAHRPPAPDDDPEFLTRLERQHQQTERERLRAWEDELQRREQEFREQEFGEQEFGEQDEQRPADGDGSQDRLGGESSQDRRGPDDPNGTGRSDT